MSWLLDKIAGIFNNDADNATGSVGAENGFVLKNSTKVSELKQAFNERFGSQLRVYEGRSQVDDAATLAEVGLTNEGTFECRGNLQVSTFITRMAEEYGLKVKVYTCDNWVAVLDGLTLTASGFVKKSATKADMETMLAGQSEGSDTSGKIPVSEVKAGGFSIIKNSDSSYSVAIDGSICSNSKGAMRQIAEALGFEYDKAWTTIQFGANLSKFIQENTGVAESTPNHRDVPAQEPDPAVDELKAEAAEAEAKKAKKASKHASNVSNEGALPGVFTLDDGRKIRFSKGFLQYNPKKYEFRFAEHQYEHIGSDGDENCKPGYDGWIDLFGWGTSGYMGCQPTENSLETKHYGPEEGDLTGDNANYDWGVYNPITNGGNQEGLWRTISDKELDFLKSKRSNAQKLFLKCSVCGKEGMVLLPDAFWSNRLSFIIDATPDKYSDNTFDKDQWTILESMGAVFFPKHRYKIVKEKEISYCSTLKETVWDKGCETWYTTFFWKSNRPSYDTPRKFPVRLIKDVK